MCHLCLGFRPYSLWSHLGFSALSTAQLTRVLGRSRMRMLLNLVIAVMSMGRPLVAILPITQAPWRVLRNVCQKKGRLNVNTWDIYSVGITMCSAMKEVRSLGSLPNNKEAFLFVSCLTISADLLISTAISPPELPMPTTTTLFPLQASASLYSQL